VPGEPNAGSIFHEDGAKMFDHLPDAPPSSTTIAGAAGVTPCFENSDVAERILGVEVVSGHMFFCLSWKNYPATYTLVSREKVRLHVPLLLIDFYESHLHLLPRVTAPPPPTHLPPPPPPPHPLAPHPHLHLPFHFNEI
jgi:hypothetical protein